ncbi:MAG: hypothetical protein OXG91_13960 [bacterium]|nr:hypothetical protein [bacterium]
MIGGLIVLTSPAAAQEPTTAEEGSEVRIAARRLDDGRIEFALQQRQGSSWGQRELPRSRFFPTDAAAGRWLSSTPLEVGGAEVRIAARRLDDGRVEFALQQRQGSSWGQRQLPRSRFFPTDAAAGRWLSSTPLRLGAASAADARFTAISIGAHYSCGLRSDGAVVCVDDRGFKIDVPDGRYTAVEVHRELDAMCALAADGTATCWDHLGEQVDAPAPEGGFTDISLSEAVGLWSFDDLACGLRADGTATCWELGEHGQYHGQYDVSGGPYTSIDATGRCGLEREGAISCWTPSGEVDYTVEGPFTEGPFTVLAGDGCGLRSDGTLACWSQAYGDGRLPGDDTEPPEGSEGRFSAVSSGEGSSCGLRLDGTVRCWGRSRMAPSGRFSAVDVGYQNSCGLRTDGSVACWGSDAGGLVSDAPEGRFTAIAVHGDEPNYGDVHGEEHRDDRACALATNGTISCWGRIDRGPSDAVTGQFTELVTLAFASCALSVDGEIGCWGTRPALWAGGDTPVHAPAGRFVAISISGGFNVDVPRGLGGGSRGIYEICGVRVDGTIACEHGLPLGLTSDPPDRRFTDINGDCGLRADGTVTCWNYGSVKSEFDLSDVRLTTIDGDCGLRADGAIICWDSTGVQRDGPAEGRFTAIDGSCGLRADGAIICWRYDDEETYGPEGRFTAIDGNCGLRADGAIICWRSDDEETYGPEGRFTAIDGSCGLRADGAIICWRYDDEETYGPEGRFTAISGSCGLRADGTVSCYDLEAPDGLYSSLTGSRSHACAIRSDGGVRCWGSVQVLVPGS